MSDTDAAWVIAQKVILSEPILAVHTTAPTIVCEYVNDSGAKYTSHFCMSSTDANFETTFITWIKEEKEKKPDLTEEHIKRIENDAFDDLYEASATLRSHVLPKGICHVKYKRRVIDDMCKALDIQTGAHFKEKGDKSREVYSIPGRLKKMLGKDNAWVKQYLDEYHIYSPPVKHRRNQKHVDARKKIGSGFGRDIAVGYFEAVRKFFVKYYGDTWKSYDSLQPIDYKLYGLNINVVDP